MISLLIIYLASVIGAYLTFRRFYSEVGEWENLSLGRSELFFIFVPGVSIFVCLVGVADLIINFTKSLKIGFKRFFRIKK